MIRALLDRRVPQLVGVYVAGGWGFVQFVDWAVDEYALSPSLTWSRPYSATPDRGAPNSQEPKQLRKRGAQGFAGA